MADLSINKIDDLALSDDAGNNLIHNGDFELAPSFTAATTTSSRWIDGTAAGSTTNDTYGWALIGTSGSARFDTSQAHSGTTSLKVSTTASSQNPNATNRLLAATTAPGRCLGIPITPGTAYRFAFYMMTNYTSGDSNDGAFMFLKERNPAGSSTASTVSTKVKTTTGWTLYTLTFTANAASTHLDIQPTVTGNTGAATLVMDSWFDDMIFRPITPNGQVDVPLTPVVTPGVQDVSGPKIWG